MAAGRHTADAEGIPGHALPALGPGQVGIVDRGHRQLQPSPGEVLAQLAREGALAGPHRPVEPQHRPMAGVDHPAAVLQEQQRQRPWSWRWLDRLAHEPSLKASSTKAYTRPMRRLSSSSQPRGVRSATIRLRNRTMSSIASTSSSAT